MRAIPEEMRQRIVAVYLRDKPTFEALAQRFSISASCACRIVKRFREEGLLTPRPKPGRPHLYGERCDFLLQQVTGQPDVTLAELQHAVRSHFGDAPSVPTLHRILRRLGFTRKKSQNSQLSKAVWISRSHVSVGEATKKTAMPSS